MLEARFRPLSDWPQADTKARRPPQFRSYWSQTLDLLDDELRHLGAKDVVIETFHRRSDIRADGWPRADARVPPHPGVVLSFASKFGPLRYLTDQFESGGFWVPSERDETGKTLKPPRTVPIPGWQANLRAIALSLEALRAVDRYGVSRRGEQYTGWNALPPGRPMGPAMTVEEAKGHLDDFGLEPFTPEGLTSEMVQEAWRAAAKVHHPDLGGTPEAFRKITEAKDLLLGWLGR